MTVTHWSKVSFLGPKIYKRKGVSCFFFSSLLLQAVLKQLKWSFLSEILRHLPVYFWNCNKIKFLPSIPSLQNLLYTHLCSSKCMYSFLVNCYYTYVHVDVYICIFTVISTWRVYTVTLFSRLTIWHWKTNQGGQLPFWVLLSFL